MTRGPTHTVEIHRVQRPSQIDKIRSRLLANDALGELYALETLGFDELALMGWHEFKDSTASISVPDGEEVA